MYCVMIRARPDYSAEDDADEWAGAYANCYIEFPDSRGAEVLARWYLADVGFIPECVLQMRTVDPEDVDEDVAAYIREAQTDGYSLVIHEWPEGAGGCSPGRRRRLGPTRRSRATASSHRWVLHRGGLGAGASPALAE